MLVPEPGRIVATGPPEAVTWRTADRAWPATVLARDAEWVRIDVPEAGVVVTAHASTLGPSEPATPRTWLLIGDPDGEMRLAVQAEPPWPELAYEAAAIVAVIDKHHRAGNDALAEVAARRLEGVLEALRRGGVEAWLAS